jgi:hypothetical protein
VHGIDSEDQPQYPGDRFTRANVCKLDGSRYSRYGFIVASPPCHEFSYRDLPFGRTKTLPPPDLSIAEACWRIARKAGLPMILENVRGAVKYFGPPTGKYGPFYLWGDVPALLPLGKPEKGFGSLGVNHDGLRVMGGPRRFWSKSSARREFAAKAATIPIELAEWIGVYAMRDLSMRRADRTKERHP